jgi:uncharacterized protein
LTRADGEPTFGSLWVRNPQTFVENIFHARPSDYKTITESVYHGGSNASSVRLPIVQ